MDFTTIFSKNFLFDPNPPVKTPLYLPLLIAFGLFIIISVLIALQKEENKKITGRFFLPFITSGIVGLIALFARYESLPYLSTRFFLLIIIAGFAVWTLVLFVQLIKFVPKHLNSKKTEDRYNKYLPKTKKRK